MNAKQKFVTQIVMLGETLGRPLTELAIDGYWLALQDLTEEAMATATKRALSECQFMPSPGQLREFVGATSNADSLIAWDAVRAALRKYSYTSSVDFGPLVNAVIRSMGGWRALDDMATAQLDVWGKKEFERVYALLEPKDPATLSGAPFLSAYGEDCVRRIAIGGVTPPLQIATKQANGVAEHIRRLAESKSIPPKETR